MAEEVKEPKEVEELEQPVIETGELSEKEQDDLFDKESLSEEEPAKKEKKPAEEIAADAEAEAETTRRAALSEDERKVEDGTKAEDERRAALSEDDRKAEDEANAKVVADEKTATEEAEAAEKAKTDKLISEKADEKIAEKEKAEAEAKAAEPTSYEDLMPKLREELGETEVPILGADGKPTGKTASLGDLLETYEDDVVPLIAAIMNSKTFRSEMGKGAQADSVASAVPQETIDEITALRGNQALMSLCMSLATPDGGGHADAYTIATSEGFSTWLGEQPEALRSKANTPDVAKNREVIEAYKLEKGLMKDPAKIEQERKAKEEADLHSITSGGGGRKGDGQGDPAATEADLDKVFEEETNK